MPLAQAMAPGSRATAGVAALGRAWWATGDARYGQAFERFYLETETGQMFNWDNFKGSQGALELDAFFLLSDCPGFTSAGRIAFLDHLFAITENAWTVHTSRWDRLMLGPEGHNWYLHGMHGVPLVGLLFPECSRSPFWLRASWSIVEEHVRGHYKEDGGARETCIGYQIGSVLKLWDLYLIAKRNGHPHSDAFADRVLRATLFVLRLMTPQGGIPAYGDSGHQAGGLTQLAAVAAALTGDSYCKWYAEYCRACRVDHPKESPDSIPYQAFWDVGLEGAATYAASRPRHPRHVSVLMGPTGYAALRDGDSRHAAYMAVAAADRGPIVTSHGHNDIFSLEVHAEGGRFVGELAWTPYGNSPGRQYDLTTEAHTCLTVNGQEQVPIIDEWRWSGRVSPCVRRWISEPTHDFFHGVHEGYYRYRANETLHDRKILFLKSPGRRQGPGYWIVVDWIQARNENDYRAYFHGCVPGRVEGKRVVLGEPKGPRLAIIPPSNDTLTAETVHSAGLEAYIREKHRRDEEYPCFAFSRRGQTVSMIYVLVPLVGDSPPPEVRRIGVRLDGTDANEGDACAVEVRFEGHTDYACISHKDFDAELEFGGHRAAGFLAFRRVNKRGEKTLSLDQTVRDGICGR
jgi:hypothetical protein